MNKIDKEKQQKNEKQQKQQYKKREMVHFQRLYFSNCCRKDPFSRAFQS